MRHYRTLSHVSCSMQRDIPKLLKRTTQFVDLTFQKCHLLVHLFLVARQKKTVNVDPSFSDLLHVHVVNGVRQLWIV